MRSPSEASRSTPAPERRGSPSHDNHFNLLRLLFASLVIVSHSPNLVDGDRTREPLVRLFHTISFGELAVDCFFLVSGYLIVQSWVASPRPLTFLKKRVLRIYPGFIAASLVCALVVGPLGAEPGSYFARFQVVPFLRSVALLHGPEVPPVFAGQPYPSINGSMWTIYYEFLCYLGVLGLGMVGLIKRPRTWFVLTGVFGALYAYQVFRRAGVGGGLGDHLLRFPTFFLVGGSYFLLRQWIPHKPWMMLAALVVLCCGLMSFRSAEMSLALFGGYAIFWFAFRPIPWLLRFNALPDISYGVYLYAWPAQKLLLYHYRSMSPWTLCVVTAAICAVVGTASWYLVEGPFMRLKRSSAAA